MTEIGNMPDDQYQRIIEAATLMHRMQYLDEGEELERVDRAFQAALSQLAPESTGVMMMVAKLLDGKPYSITGDNPDSIRLCIDLAHKINATVEDSEGHPLFGNLMKPGLRSIRIYPASLAKQ